MKKEDIRRRLSAIVKKISPLTPISTSSERSIFSADGKTDALDSVAALQLVLALEEEFGITVQDEDISAEHFSNLNSLCQYVATKLPRA